MLLCSALPPGHLPDHQPIRCIACSGSASARAVHRLVLIERSLASRPAFRTGFRCVQRASRHRRPLRVRHRKVCYARVSDRERYEASGAALSGPVMRSARGNARRRCASSKHARLGCRYAPRPGCRAWGSGTMSPPATTRRSRLDFAARSLQPTQVRTGKLPGSGRSVRTVIPHVSLPCHQAQGTRPCHRVTGIAGQGRSGPQRPVRRPTASRRCRRPGRPRHRARLRLPGGAPGRATARRPRCPT